MNLQYSNEDKIWSKQDYKIDQQQSEGSQQSDTDSESQTIEKRTLPRLKRDDVHSSSMIFNQAHHHHSKISENSHLDNTPPRPNYNRVIEQKNNQTDMKQKGMLKKLDISRMTLSEIKSLAIYDYGKSVYDQAFAMVQNIQSNEKLNAERDIILAVEVLVRYYSQVCQFIEVFKLYLQYGEQVLLTGNIPQLGKWSSKGVAMQWTHSHYWKLLFDKSFIQKNQQFQYKFVVTNGLMITKWQKGENKLFALKDYIEQIKEAIEDRPSYISKNNIYQLNQMNQLVGDYSMHISYDPKNKRLMLKHLW